MANSTTRRLKILFSSLSKRDFFLILLSSLFMSVIVFLLTITSVFFNPIFHSFFVSNSSDFSQDFLIEQNKNVMTYIMTGSLNNISQFSPEAISHFQDVRVLFIEGVSILLLVILIFILMYNFILKNKKHRQLLFIFQAPIGVLFLLINTLSILLFSQFFEQFHKLFFPQGNYSFYFNSLIISTYPNNFFLYGYTTVVCVTTVILGFISYLAFKDLKQFVKVKKKISLNIK